MSTRLMVTDLVEKFLDRTQVERSPDTHRDYKAMLGKLVRGFPWHFQKRK